MVRDEDGALDEGRNGRGPAEAALSALQNNKGIVVPALLGVAAAVAASKGPQTSANGSSLASSPRSNRRIEPVSCNTVVHAHSTREPVSAIRASTCAHPNVSSSPL
jgi:hypothetical protein